MSIRIFNFNHFRRQGDFIRNIYSGEIWLEQAIERQNEIEDLLRSLNAYKPKPPPKKIQSEKGSLR